MDQKLITEAIPPALPYIKRQALAAITGEYATAELALRGISQSLRTWYAENYPEVAASREDLLNQAMRGAQQAYKENVFPRMNIGWGTYRSFLGHAEGSGCFRCHGRLFEQTSGERLFADCDVCHLVIAEDEPALDSAAAVREGTKYLLK